MISVLPRIPHTGLKTRLEQESVSLKLIMEKKTDVHRLLLTARLNERSGEKMVTWTACLEE